MAIKVKLMIHIMAINEGSYWHQMIKCTQNQSCYCTLESTTSLCTFPNNGQRSKLFTYTKSHCQYTFSTIPPPLRTARCRVSEAGGTPQRSGTATVIVSFSCKPPLLAFSAVTTWVLIRHCQKANHGIIRLGFPFNALEVLFGTTYSTFSLVEAKINYPPHDHLQKSSNYSKTLETFKL